MNINAKDDKNEILTKIESNDFSLTFKSVSYNNDDYYKRYYYNSILLGLNHYGSEVKGEVSSFSYEDLKQINQSILSHIQFIENAIKKQNKQNDKDKKTDCYIHSGNGGFTFQLRTNIGAEDWNDYILLNNNYLNSISLGLNHYGSQLNINSTGFSFDELKRISEALISHIQLIEDKFYKK